MKKHIPNAITLVNVLAGCMAIVAVLEGKMTQVPYFLLVCFIADYTDGLAARALNAKSELGKQLDSLADMVSFGVLPSMILFVLMRQSLYGSTPPDAFLGPELLAFSVAMFAALRLGKFNIDTRQTESFIGLPTPAMTLFVLGLLLINQHSSLELWTELTKNATFLGVISLVLSILMVIELPLLSLKMTSFSLGKYKWQWILALGSLGLILIFQVNSLPMVITYYLVLSLLHTKKGKS